MPNTLLPAIKVAKGCYEIARKNGLPESIALEVARGYAPDHTMGEGGKHAFSDEEIRNGICECAECAQLLS